MQEHVWDMQIKWGLLLYILHPFVVLLFKMFVFKMTVTACLTSVRVLSLAHSLCGHSANLSIEGRMGRLLHSVSC